MNLSFEDDPYRQDPKFISPFTEEISNVILDCKINSYVSLDIFKNGHCVNPTLTLLLLSSGREIPGFI